MIRMFSCVCVCWYQLAEQWSQTDVPQLQFLKQPLECGFKTEAIPKDSHIKMYNLTSDI